MRLICPIKQIFVAILYQTQLSCQGGGKERKNFQFSPLCALLTGHVKIGILIPTVDWRGEHSFSIFSWFHHRFICIQLVQIIKLWLAVAPSPTSGGKTIVRIIILCFRLSQVCCLSVKSEHTQSNLLSAIFLILRK